MNVIAIYHHPQECGSPYIAFVNQKSGNIVNHIDIPEGYYYSGRRRVEILHKKFDFTEECCSTRIPTPESYVVRAQYGSPGKKYRYRVTSVDVNGEDFEILHTYNCTVHIDACEVEDQWVYFPEEDTFRQGMEEQGFDMSQWPIERREKTDLDVFLQDVASIWNPDYHLVNLIHIG